MVERQMMEHRKLWTAAGIFSLVVLVSGCSSESLQDGVDNPPAQQQAKASSKPKIVALGDSITAGYGLSRDLAYPNLLQKRLPRKTQPKNNRAAPLLSLAYAPGIL